MVSVISPYRGDLVEVEEIMASMRKPCDADKHKVLIKTVCEEGEPYERIIDLARKL